ncbi:hypothetical protein KQX54_007906 [Cotesia glomerata]|uniref:Uncharacterized protein n=1 Tax=Cotesia glomerata TaxID=32391 RepID=A0AAV7J3K1_COTGL|nr:hypothetical protein KQX54_007906 [Cotesia glomerata]
MPRIYRRYPPLSLVILSRRLGERVGVYQDPRGTECAYLPIPGIKNRTAFNSLSDRHSPPLCQYHVVNDVVWVKTVLYSEHPSSEVGHREKFARHAVVTFGVKLTATPTSPGSRDFHVAEAPPVMSKRSLQY